MSGSELPFLSTRQGAGKLTLRLGLTKDIHLLFSFPAFFDAQDLGDLQSSAALAATKSEMRPVLPPVACYIAEIRAKYTQEDPS